MSKKGCSAIEWVSVTPLILTLQNTRLSGYLPFVRFRNLNIMTFLAAGMLLASQNSPLDVTGPTGPVVSLPQPRSRVPAATVEAIKVLASRAFKDHSSEW